MSLLVAEAYKNTEWRRHCLVYKYNRAVNNETVEYMQEVFADPNCCSHLFYMKYPSGWREFEGIHPCNYDLYDKDDLWYYLPDGILRHWKHLNVEWQKYIGNLFKAASEGNDDFDPSDDDIDLGCHSDEEDDVVCLGAAPLKKRKVETVDLTDE